MPNAQVSDAPERKELATCPGAYVELKRLTYGEKLLRNEKAAQNTIRGDGRSTEMSIQIMQRETNFLDFASCIVGHNLTYTDSATGEELPFDFKGRAWQQLLDPRIGEEIASLIDSMNNYEKVDDPKL